MRDSVSIKVIEFVLPAPPELLHISYIVSRVFYSYLEKIHCSAVTVNLYSFQNVISRSPACDTSLLH